MRVRVSVVTGVAASASAAAAADSAAARAAAAAATLFLLGYFLYGQETVLPHLYPLGHVPDGGVLCETNDTHARPRAYYLLFERNSPRTRFSKTGCHMVPVPMRALIVANRIYLVKHNTHIPTMTTLNLSPTPLSSQNRPALLLFSVLNPIVLNTKLTLTLFFSDHQIFINN